MSLLSLTLLQYRCIVAEYTTVSTIGVSSLLHSTVWLVIFVKQAKIRALEIFAVLIFTVDESGTHMLLSGMVKS